MDRSTEVTGARLSVASLAHRLGVAPATLRTWDRRYGLGPSEHRPGAHRRYTEADVDRLSVMRQLTLQGVPPAEAARVALGQPLHPEDLLDAPAAKGDDQSPASAAVATDRPRSAAAGGGRVLALPDADATARGLGRAAMALDARTVTETVREQIAAYGVLHTWDHVLRPVLVAVGARWARTGEGVEIEHLVADCTGAVLREAAARGEATADGRRQRAVLLACAPGEWHALPLNALAAALGERGLSSRTLGASTPGAALAAAVRRTGAAVLFVWSQLIDNGDPSVFDDVPVKRPPTALIAGGPGWTTAQLPERVSFAADLSDAVEQVQRAVGG